MIAGALAVSCCICMVLFPQVAIYSTQKGISLWIGSVLPALLPFFICANFLNYIGAVRVIRPGLFPFVMSVLSGYPMGAKIIGDMRRRQVISRKEACRLISFCSTSGPAFMIGAVGVGMLGSAAAGVVIAVSHYAAALANGVIYSCALASGSRAGIRGSRTGRADGQGGKPESARPGGGRPAASRDQDLLSLFTSAILSAFQSLAIILAYLVLFMFLTDMIHLSGVLSWIDPPAGKALIKGLFEMTVGCGALSECGGLTITSKCILSAMLLSWGGMSVIGQSMSMLSGSGVRLSYFALTKLTHSLLAGITALFLARCML